MASGNHANNAFSWLEKRDKAIYHECPQIVHAAIYSQVAVYDRKVKGIPYPDSLTPENSQIRGTFEWYILGILKHLQIVVVIPHHACCSIYLEFIWSVWTGSNYSSSANMHGFKGPSIYIAVLNNADIRTLTKKMLER